MPKCRAAAPSIECARPAYSSYRQSYITTSAYPHTPSYHNLILIISPMQHHNGCLCASVFAHVRALLIFWSTTLHSAAQRCTGLRCPVQYASLRSTVHSIVSSTVLVHSTVHSIVRHYIALSTALHSTTQRFPGARWAWDRSVPGRLPTYDCASSTSHQRKQTSLRQGNDCSLGSPVHQV